MGESRMGLGVVIPGFGGVYDPTVEYEFYVWVRDGYDAYISKKPSRGIPTSNEEYWFRLTNIEGLVITDLEEAKRIIASVSEWALKPEKPTYSYPEIADTPEIPDAVSDLANDADFQTGEQVRDAIADAVGTITGFSYSVIESLPETGAPGVIYLIGNASEENDRYDEYIWVSDRFERIGSTAIDLSNYVPVGRTINGKALSADIELSAADLGVTDAAAALTACASRWEFIRNGNPVAISPAEGSAMQVTPSADGVITQNDGDPIPVSAGTPVEIKAVVGVNTLSASAGSLRVEYNRSSMDVLTELTAKVTASGSIARVTGAASDLPLEVTVKMIAAQQGVGDLGPENPMEMIGNERLLVTQTGESGKEKTYTVELPETLYGLPNAPDEADISNGVVTRRTELITLNSDIYYDYHYLSDEFVRFAWRDMATSGLGGTKLVCTHFPYSINTSSVADITKPQIRNGPSGTPRCWIFMHASKLGITASTTTAEAVAAFKAWLTAQGAQGTPVRVLYELSAPQTLSIAPAEIFSLPGINNISADGGDTTVIYRQGAQGIADRLSVLEAAFSAK